MSIDDTLLISKQSLLDMIKTESSRKTISGYKSAELLQEVLDKSIPLNDVLEISLKREFLVND